jgi:cell division protein FtsW
MGIGTFVNQKTRPTVPTAPRQRISTGDLVLIAAVIALGIYGLLMLYSASADFSQLSGKSPTFIFNKQLLFIAAGTLVAFVASRIEYHKWQKLALPMMAVIILLLIAVLFVKDTRNGSVRTLWGGSVQPSEFAKVATIIYLAVWLYSKRDFMHDIQLGLFPLAAILGIIGGLILLQPDLSAAMTIFILGWLLFFLAGGDLRQILVFTVVALVAGFIVVKLNPTGQSRLGPYLAGLKDPLNSSDHVLWSLESIFNGKLFGVGIGNATTKLIGLPFSATDSIFAVLVEELGFAGALALLSLYGVILWRGLKIASRAPDMLGTVMAAGLTFWIVIEAAINICMMVGLFPVAGNALPLVSAGGSNLVSTLAAVGILLGISRQSGKKSPAEKEERRSYGAVVDLRGRNRRRSLSSSRRAGSRSR